MTKTWFYMPYPEIIMEATLAAIRKRPQNPFSVDMNRIVTVILGGGQGTRLFPLTTSHCKPAISFGGRYRLIDVPISNAINSGCSRIFILTQFLSTSLHKHIRHTYHSGTFFRGSIDLLSVEEKPTHKAWFQGTADAVRQSMDYLIETPADYFLILSGDQLYNFNFQDMFRFSIETDADLVIAALQVNAENAQRMGILKINENRFITEFQEKPQDPQILERLRLRSEPNQCEDRYLGSMGIYLFKRQALFELLQRDPRADFGKHLIPTKVEQGNAVAYIFDSYWEDIGTIESFFRANIALTESSPPFHFYDEQNPIITSPSHLPPAKIMNATINHSIICEGSLIDASDLTHVICGPRTIIKKGSIIKNTYILGNDYYHCPVTRKDLAPSPMIGENCIIDKAIIDKHVYIGNGVQLVNQKKLDHYNGDNIFIREGVIVVARGASLPDGFVL